MAQSARSRAVIRLGQQGVLMTPVVGQLEAGNQAIFLMEPSNQLPGAILLPSPSARMRLSSHFPAGGVKPRSFP